MAGPGLPELQAHRLGRAKKRLRFTADIDWNDTMETLDWSIKPDGTDLRME